MRAQPAGRTALARFAAIEELLSKEPHWIRFVVRPREPGRRTYVWAVQSKDGGEMLGEVRWYHPWRCYAFEPRGMTVFERRCLRDIADFCDGWTMKQKDAPHEGVT